MRAWIAGICLILAMGPAGAQNADLSRANTLYLEGKKIEALPLYEQLAREHPGEWLYLERLADCLAAKSAQTEDPAEATAIRTEMRDAAKKAVELGDPNRYLQVMASIDPSRPLLPESTSPGNALLKEAEKAYGAGNFTLAMEKYTAAYEADPKLYNAALFAGDTAYVQKDLKTAALWFARAIAIDPDRETAYRYWGDAILRLGNDPVAARQKFIDAVVAEPYNRMSWQGIEQWAQARQAIVLAPKIDRPAAPKVDKDKPNTTNIVIDFNSLDDKKNPGGFAWMMYSMVRANLPRGHVQERFSRGKGVPPLAEGRRSCAERRGLDGGGEKDQAEQAGREPAQPGRAAQGRHARLLDPDQRGGRGDCPGLPRVPQGTPPAIARLS